MVGTVVSVIEATPLIGTPAAEVSASALALASAMASWRAWAWTLFGSLRRKLMPLTVVAPAAIASSIDRATDLRLRTVTLTVLVNCWPTSFGAEPLCCSRRRG